jgi:hypothetical protein
MNRIKETALYGSDPALRTLRFRVKPSLLFEMKPTQLPDPKRSHAKAQSSQKDDAKVAKLEA